MKTPEERLAEAGLLLPKLSSPRGSYRQWKIAGSLLFTAGKGLRLADGSVRPGKLGRNLTVEEGYNDARLAGLHLLRSVKDAMGELSRVCSVVTVFGMLNATPDFDKHAVVINGCSDLFLLAFGNEIGSHARSAVGMSSLPEGMSVEIEAIFEV